MLLANSLSKSCCTYIHNLLFFFCEINEMLPFGICTQGLGMTHDPDSELRPCDSDI